jgi:hypothetical protein
MSNEPPKTVIEAVNWTSDEKTLSLLWKISRARVAEENARTVAIHDRASKYITYGLSLVSADLVILGFLKDDIAIWLARDGVAFLLLSLEALLFVLSLGSFFLALHTSSVVIREREWRTWKESDVARVDLGSAELAYLRFIIAASWRVLTANAKLSNEVLGDLSKALRRLRIGVGFQVAFFMAAAVGHAFFPPPSKDYSERSFHVQSVIEENNVSNQTKTEQSKPAATPQPTTPQRPAPVPMPSEGEPLKKSLNPKPPTKSSPK